MAGDDERPGPSSDERRQRTRTWPWASSPAETALISYSVRVGCQPSTGWSASSTALNSALTGPLPVDSALRSSPPTLSVTVPVGVAAVRRGHAPAHERDARLDLGRALLHEREEVGVGDLLLRVRELDRLAVDLLERVALEVIAEFAQLALQIPRRPDSLPIVSWLPDSPTDCGVMIS